MAGTETARLIRPLHVRGPGLGRNNGMNGRDMGKSAKGEIAKKCILSQNLFEKSRHRLDITP